MVQVVEERGRTLRSSRKKQNSEKIASYSIFMFKFVCVILAFTSVFVIHLYLRQQCVKSAERTDNIKRQLMDVKVENMNLRNKVASLTGWPHISRKIREFNLALRPAESGQIVRIVVYSPKQAAAIPLTPIKVASAGNNSRYRTR